MYSTRYDWDKTIAMLNLYHHELILKIKEHGGKTLDDWWLYAR